MVEQDSVDNHVVAKVIFVRVVVSMPGHNIKWGVVLRRAEEEEEEEEKERGRRRRRGGRWGGEGGGGGGCTHSCK